jgi:ribosomal protein L40E
VSMVSTVICPRCKTKNSKKAELCYKCKNPLKPGKSRKSNPLSFDPKSRFDLRIIITGLILFVLCNIAFLYISPDYSMLMSGFVVMLFLYLLFKHYMEPNDPSMTIKTLGLKVILYYLIIIALGVVVLLLFHLY